MQATDLRKGTTIRYNGDLCTVIEFRHFTPGNKRAFVQASMKSLKSGKILQNRFASTEEVEYVALDPRKCQYLYHDDEGYHFMDMEDYHTFQMSDDVVGDDRYYLKENMEMKIDFYEGIPVAPEFPKTVVLKLTEAPPWVKGDSVSNNTKPAVTETGLKIMVPIFLEEGTEIKVSTETGEYLGRA